MYIASKAERTGNNAHAGVISGAIGGDEQGQARKKARVEGTGASGTKTKSPLRVDVNALRLPSPRDARQGGGALRRSPIAFDRAISGDGSIHETGDAAANRKSTNDT